MCAQLPDDDINNPVHRTQLARTGEKFVWGGEGRLNVWLSVNNWTRSCCKNRPALLYPGLIHWSSEDWGIMMERPPDISHRSEVLTAPTHWSSQDWYRSLQTGGELSEYWEHSICSTSAEFTNIMKWPYRVLKGLLIHFKPFLIFKPIDCQTLWVAYQREIRYF